MYWYILQYKVNTWKDQKKATESTYLWHLLTWLIKRLKNNDRLDWLNSETNPTCEYVSLAKWPRLCLFPDGGKSRRQIRNIHLDVCGPIKRTYIYESDSRFGDVYLMTHKSESLKSPKNFDWKSKRRLVYQWKKFDQINVTGVNTSLERVD